MIFLKIKNYINFIIDLSLMFVCQFNSYILESTITTEGFIYSFRDEWVS